MNSNYEGYVEELLMVQYLREVTGRSSFKSCSLSKYIKFVSAFIAEVFDVSCCKMNRSLKIWRWQFWIYFVYSIYIPVSSTTHISKVIMHDQPFYRHSSAEIWESVDFCKKRLQILKKNAWKKSIRMNTRLWIARMLIVKYPPRLLSFIAISWRLPINNNKRISQSYSLWSCFAWPIYIWFEFKK